MMRRGERDLAHLEGALLGFLLPCRGGAPRPGFASAGRSPSGEVGCGSGAIASPAAACAARAAIARMRSSASIVASLTPHLPRGRCAPRPSSAEARRSPGVSRLVVHVPDPVAFVRAQVARVVPGGVVIASDHTTDPDPERARWHQEIERARDRTRVRNLTPGEPVDVLARAGLEQLRLLEEPFELDFDDWFDRGTPTLPKDEVRKLVFAGSARGFEPVRRGDGGVSIRSLRVLVRGVRPFA